MTANNAADNTGGSEIAQYVFFLDNNINGTKIISTTPSGSLTVSAGTYVGCCVAIDKAGNQSNTVQCSNASTIVSTWTQNKTSVTNGTVTLEVGSAVTGYSANGVGNGSWFVLGAEEGKLLITTNSYQGGITLSGQDGYENGVSTLNTAATAYSDGNMADSSRSINVEDINRVTGYNPNTAEYNKGEISEWGNKVTYKLEVERYVSYVGTKYPTWTSKSNVETFTHWTRI